MPKWYDFKAAAAESEVASVSIFDDIGYWGVTAQSFINDMKASIGSAKSLDVEINSPGGSVFDGLAIHNALRNLSASGVAVNVKVMGVAASIASIVAMAGDTITMPENAFMMIHQPWSFAGGNAGELRAEADVLDKLNNSLVAIYTARTGKPEADIRAMLATDTWLSAAEAKEAGFATEVTPAFQATARFDEARLPENVKAIFAKKVVTPPAAGQRQEPAPTTGPTPQEPFADQVLALATAAQLDAFAPQWAIEHSDITAVQAAISNAREINSLCALAKRPDDAQALIKTGKTVAEARTHLMTALAVVDERTAIDTTLKNSTQQATNDAQPPAFSTAAVWAVRRKNQGVKA